MRNRPVFSDVESGSIMRLFALLDALGDAYNELGQQFSWTSGVTVLSQDAMRVK